MTLERRYSSHAQHAINKLSERLRGRILARISELQEEPFPPDAKRVVNRKEKTFRVRVGGYRILYVVLAEEGILFISDVDKRERVY